MSELTKLALWHSETKKGDVLGIRFGDNKNDKMAEVVFMHGESMLKTADKLEGLAIMIRKYESELTDKKETK